MENGRVALAGALALAMLLEITAAASEPAPVSAEPTEALRDDGAVLWPSADEELIVVGRLYNSAQQLLNERKDDEVVADVLGEEAISRLGDTTVAVALRRMPGLTLVRDKFIYVRGLGERYSSALLNGASIPSPDLTRNVVPLDIFPAAIVKSLRVQKSYSADMPAAFGGGAVDIRTKGIPRAFTYAVELGTGYNFANDGKAFTYAGGDDDRFGTDDGTRAMSPALGLGIERFAGAVDVQGILNAMRREGDGDATVADARRVNRELALLLNRDISVSESAIEPDANVKASIGHSMLFGADWEFGFLLAGGYKDSWREEERLSRNFRFPQQRTDRKLESTYSVDLTGNLSLGLHYADDHELATNTLYLRNTDDETAIRDFFNENREISDEIGFREYRLQFEERELVVNQATGSHRFGDATRGWPVLRWFDYDWIPADAEFSWRYSEARAGTSIPNQVNVDAQTVTEPGTGRAISSAVSVDATTADYRFTNLDDEVRNYGWQAVVPFRLGESFLDVAFGYDNSRKVRAYRQSQFSLGALSVVDPDVLRGPIGEVFSDANILDPRNNFVFDLSGTNNQSYLAANLSEAAFAKVDWSWRELWLASLGARWEDYKQVALDWNLYGFSVDDPPVTTDPEELARAVFADDRIYPALSLTRVVDGDWWRGLGVELFQVRFGWSETVVRPDLREITDASYVDPITDDLVDGNPGVVPSNVTNYDLRAEWFFSNGDNFTASLFYKGIDSPIEFFESAASDTTVAREIVNARSATVYGVEIEALKELGFLRPALGDWAQSLFIQGNLTLQTSELVAGEAADAPTSQMRPLAGASQSVVNLIVGFDSYDGRHTATLAYNVFGERLYVAGRLGAPDGYEQPFHALDFTYSWFPTESLTVKAKLRNLLDGAVEIERDSVLTFTERPGRAASVSVKWGF